GNAFDRHDLFAVRRVEDRDALGGTSSNADAVNRHADKLSAVRNEQNLVACLDREQGDELADFVGLRRIGGADALAATAGNAELVGRGALAVTIFADRQHGLFARFQLLIAFFVELGFVSDLLANHHDIIRVICALGTAFGNRTLQIGRALSRVRIDVMQDGHGDDLVAIGQIDAAHADGVAARKDAHIGDGEANALATGAGQKHVVEFRTRIDREDFIALVFELHRDLAVAVDLNEVRQLVTANRTARGREHDVEICPGILILGQRHDSGDALALLQWQHVDERLAARLRRADRQTPDLLLVDDATRGEEQNRRMRIGHEQARDEILVLRRHAGAALAAAALRTIGRQRHALDVARMADGDDHILTGDQVFVIHFGAAETDFSAAWGCELVANRNHLFLDDG